LYAKNLALVQAFYAVVAGLGVQHAENNHVVLESPGFLLTVVEISERIASTIEITNPPRRRIETPIKLVFPVASLEATRALAASHGGELNAPEREWEFLGRRVCDGQDPEGNVVQFWQDKP